MGRMIISIIILVVLSSFTLAYTYDAPNSFARQFYEYTPNELRNNLLIEFVSEKNKMYDGYCWCWNKPYGLVTITIYKNAWKTHDYRYVKDVLNHELKHAYQCKILNEYPNHNETFYNINIME